MRGDGTKHEREGGPEESRRPSGPDGAQGGADLSQGGMEVVSRHGLFHLQGGTPELQNVRADEPENGVCTDVARHEQQEVHHTDGRVHLQRD